MAHPLWSGGLAGEGASAPVTLVLEQQEKSVSKAPPEFSMRDAQNLLAVARSAAIPNMAEAEARGLLFQRFQSWAVFHLVPATEPAESEADSQQPAP